MVVTLRWSGLPIVALATLLAACALAPSQTIPAGPVPDLRGTWQGTWGGTPLTLVVLEQHAVTAVDGVFVGPWHLGRTLPSVSGILTLTVRGEPVSVNVKGPLGDVNGRLTLVLESVTPGGGRLTLARVDDNRLSGVGTTPLSWEPQGPVELVRQPSGSARP